MKTVKSFINVAHKLSRFQWLPWIVVGVAIITVALHEVYFPPWLENLPSLFEQKNAKKEKENEKETEHLQRKVGQLTMEVEFLEKKCKQLGIPVKGRNS